MTAYYNEIDPYAAQWLRNLIAAGHIAPGEVDERDIRDVRPADLRGFVQCHFFAGIGIWSHALRLAGWPDDRSVWTGSCPCQPFSSAGKGGGFDDERHLWPAFFHLIGECRPDIVFGEQVASKDGYAWLDLVQADLEGSGHAFGAVVAPAAGFGAPQIRHRTYWVAGADGREPRSARELQPCGQHGLLAKNGSPLRQVRQRAQHTGPFAAISMDRSDSARRDARAPATEVARHGRSAGSDGGAVILGGTLGEGLALGSQPTIHDRHLRFQRTTLDAAEPVRGHWSGADWIWCRDGKYRPVEPGSFPLADGHPGRVGKLRAYGNAIVPQQAAEFIAAYMAFAETAGEAVAA